MRWLSQSENGDLFCGLSVFTSVHILLMTADGTGLERKESIKSEASEAESYPVRQREKEPGRRRHCYGGTGIQVTAFRVTLQIMGSVRLLRDPVSAFVWLPSPAPAPPSVPPSPVVSAQLSSVLPDFPPISPKLISICSVTEISSKLPAVCVQFSSILANLFAPIVSPPACC